MPSVSRENVLLVGENIPTTVISTRFSSLFIVAPFLQCMRGLRVEELKVHLVSMTELGKTRFPLKRRT
jgi:hypothetical protein